MQQDSTTATNDDSRGGSALSEQVCLEPERAAFEQWFAESRRNRGAKKSPTFDTLGDGTYADDHAQRHWWTWQQAQAAERERWERAATMAVQELAHCAAYTTAGIACAELRALLRT